MSRRDVLRYAAAATPAVLGMSALSAVVGTAAGTPQASAAPLGVLLDYAAGVINAAELRASGALGAIRYVSDRRPGGAWMLGKPIQIAEARDLYRSGLKIVSCYQYGKQDNADWLAGEPAGIQHAQRGWQLHVAAGGPIAAPIYTSIDDDPTFEQYKRQVAPYLRGWGAGPRAAARRRLRQLQDHRVGTSGRPRVVLLAAQLGLARAGRTPGRPPPSGGD